MKEANVHDEPEASTPYAQDGTLPPQPSIPKVCNAQCCVESVISERQTGG